jgi:hypothetical protein
MWRSVFVVLLLMVSPAVAGQSKATFQVGITITGTVARPAAKAATVGAGQQRGAGSPSRAKEQRR